MSFRGFPSKIEVIERLDARFGKASGGRLSDDAKKAVIDGLNENLSTKENAEAAVAAMRSAIVLIEAGSYQSRVDYLRGTADLQVSKGGGLLAFTGIIAAIAGIGFEKMQPQDPAFWVCISAGLLAVVASVISLSVVWSAAPSRLEFQDAINESEWLADLVSKRGAKSNWAVRLSRLATILLAVSALLSLLPLGKVATPRGDDVASEVKDQSKADSPPGAAPAEPAPSSSPAEELKLKK